MEVNKLTNQNWFGVNYIAEPNKSTKALNNLMLLFKDAIHKYFDLDETKDPKEFIRIVKSRRDLSSGNIMFITWFEEKLPMIKYYLNQQLPESDLLTSGLKYEHYILEQEMEMEFPEDMRSCLVDIINYLPDRIKESR